MIRKISSEFDCVDSAEMAVSAIKSKINDISKISIRPKSNEANANSYQSKIGFFSYIPSIQLYPYGANLYAQQSLNNESTQNYNNERREVILTISCTNDNIKNVSQMITSYGGLKIKEL